MSYETSRATVERIINAKGGDITWIKKVPGIRDPNHPQVPVPAVPHSETVRVVLLPMNSSMLRTTLTALGTLGYSSDGQTLAGTDQLLMSGAVPFVPSLEDEIIIKGRTVKPVTVDTLDPDMSTPILYLVGVML
jgi:hypothetical protein